MMVFVSGPIQDRDSEVTCPMCLPRLPGLRMYNNPSVITLWSSLDKQVVVGLVLNTAVPY